MALDSKQISKRIRTFRESLPKPNTQSVFAKKLGYKDYQIKDVESGKTKVPAELISKISTVYDVNPDLFLDPRESYDKLRIKSKESPFTIDVEDEDLIRNSVIWERAERHLRKAIVREERIYEFLEARPDEKKMIFEKALNAEKAIVQAFLLHVTRNLPQHVLINLLQGFCNKKVFEPEETVYQLSLNSLYLVIRELRLMLETNGSQGDSLAY